MQNLLENAKRFYRLKLNQKLPSYKRALFKPILNSKAKITGVYGSKIELKPCKQTCI